MTSIVELCLDHLRQEETLLKSALPMVATIQDAFQQRGLAAFAASLSRHRDLVQMMDDLHQRRRRFSETMNERLGIDADQCSFSAVLARLPEAEGREKLTAAIDQVRRLAVELAGANFVVSVHVRIHLAAYRGMLRDLTQTRSGSGRYGPAGRSESLEYRPLLQIQG